MRDQAIGTGLSIFYEAWSWELEQHGNTKKADAVYREGLACNALPRDSLETAHRYGVLVTLFFVRIYTFILMESNNIFIFSNK